MNTTYFIACSAVYYAMKALVAPDVPPNDGCYRPLHVMVPPRTVLNADPDRPVVGGNHETSQRVVDAILKALAPALPDRVAAGGPTTSGLLIFGARRPDGRWSILYEVHGGGEGATAAKDGAAGSARAHVERHEHADRGHRGRVPDHDRGAGASRPARAATARIGAASASGAPIGSWRRRSR